MCVRHSKQQISRPSRQRLKLADDLRLLPPSPPPAIWTLNSLNCLTTTTTATSTSHRPSLGLDTDLDLESARAPDL